MSSLFHRKQSEAQGNVLPPRPQAWSPEPGWEQPCTSLRGPKCNPNICLVNALGPCPFWNHPFLCSSLPSYIFGTFQTLPHLHRAEDLRGDGPFLRALFSGPPAPGFPQSRLDTQKVQNERQDFQPSTELEGLPRWLSGKEPTCQCRRQRRCGFDPWIRKIPLEEELLTHSIILAWKIPWTEDSGMLQSIGVAKSQT